jgi:hypothetical protein
MINIIRTAPALVENCFRNVKTRTSPSEKTTKASGEGVKEEPENLLG